MWHQMQGVVSSLLLEQPPACLVGCMPAAVGALLRGLSFVKGSVGTTVPQSGMYCSQPGCCVCCSGSSALGALPGQLAVPAKAVLIEWFSSSLWLKRQADQRQRKSPRGRAQCHACFVAGWLFYGRGYYRQAQPGGSMDMHVLGLGPVSAGQDVACADQTFFRRYRMSGEQHKCQARPVASSILLLCLVCLVQRAVSSLSRAICLYRNQIKPRVPPVAPAFNLTGGCCPLWS